MHFCQDEVRLIIGALTGGPAVVYTLMLLRHLWHNMFHRGEPVDDGCCDGHDHEEQER